MSKKKSILKLLHINYRKVENYYLPGILFAIHFVAMIIRYVWCLVWIEGMVISNNPVYLITLAILPYPVWLFSTMCDELSYHKTKRLTLTLVNVHFLLVVLQPVWTIFYNLFCPGILKMKPTEALPVGMIINLARMAMVASMAFCGWLLGSAFLKPFAEMAVYIDAFKLSDHVDLRKNRDSRYDCRILRELRGYGKVMPIFEDDLYTHFLGLGASGTGKTSSALIPLLIGFLDKKVENRKKREMAYKGMLNAGKCYVLAPLANPTEYDIFPCEGYEDEFAEIRRRYPDMGITLVSPNDSIGRKAIRLCEARNIPINMIDPLYTYDSPVVKQLQMAPFYIPLDIMKTGGELERAIMIVSKAKIFSETLITVNEALSSSGGGEQYFKDLNTSVTSAIAIVCMLEANIKGRQTTFADIQDCVNNYMLLQPKCDFIKDALGLHISQISVGKPSGREKRGTGSDKSFEDMVNILEKADGGIREKDEKKDSFTRFIGSSVDDDYETRPRAYISAIETIQNDLIGNIEKMYDQARGLRNLMNDMVSDPRVYKLLNASSDYIDFDQIFNRCEITVVNTAMKISPTASTTIGLFFLLNHKRGVIGREEAEEDRQPHALMVDETTQYVHPWIEDSIALYRQYHCMCFYFFQSLAQLDKNNQTKYIKGVLLTVANIIAYGRLGVDEMKILEELGGHRIEQEAIITDAKNSILEENSSHTISDRRQEKERAASSGTDLRIRGFQEVTWIGSVNGSVRYATFCKLSFPKDRAYKKQNNKWLDYAKYQKPEEEIKEAVVLTAGGEMPLQTTYNKEGLEDVRFFVNRDAELLEASIAGDEELLREKDFEKRKQALLDKLQEKHGMKPQTEQPGVEPEAVESIEIERELHYDGDDVFF